VQLDARAVVADADRDLIRLGPVLDDDIDRRALTAVLRRVRQEVADDLLEIGGVGHDRRQARAISIAKTTPGQRSSSDARTRGTIRCSRTGSRPRSVSASPNRLSATTSSTSRLRRSASSATSSRISRRVASSRLLSSRESTRAPPKIVGDGRSQLVGQDADEGLANRLPLALLGDIAEHEDRLAARIALGRPVGDRIGGKLDPALGFGARPQDDRTRDGCRGAERRLRVVELREDAGVARLGTFGNIWRPAGLDRIVRHRRHTRSRHHPSHG
jgi:hypothetical protein